MGINFFVGLLFAVVLGIPSFYLVLELVLGSLLSAKKQSSGKEGQYSRKNAAILIPAHNEELIIRDTLEHLLAQVQPDDKVVVVADNCTDKTVAICNEYNVEVLERHNLEHKGKGHALDFGVAHLAATPQTSLVILDADSKFLDNSLDVMLAHSQSLDRVVQSSYLMLSPEQAPLKTRFAEFAWRIKNQIRARALTALGIGSHLQGSGMAFPWRILSEQSFASDNIVEDLELGLKIAEAGDKVYFDEEATVISYFPSSEAGIETQRTRWEHGHMASIFAQLPQVMVSSLKKLNVRAFFLALDAAIPPTVSWLLITVLAWCVAAGLTLLGIVSAWYVSSVVLLGLVLGLGLAWVVVGRSIIGFGDLLQVPGYIFSKLSVYKKFVVKRETEWVRTDRKE